MRDIGVTGVQTCALPIFVVAAAILSGPVLTAAQESRSSGDLVPLPHKLPKPVFAGTPSDAPPGTNVEKPLGRAREIGRAPCRVRGLISVGSVSLKKKSV